MIFKHNPPPDSLRSIVKIFRNLLFWCHLATGVAVGVVVLIMSVTGALLTYQRQMQWWADTRGMEAGPPTVDATRLPTGEVVMRVAAEVGEEPTSVTRYADANAPLAIAFGRGHTVYASAYTGAVLGEGAQGMRNFFRVVVSWHRWLGQTGEGRDAGRAVTGAANLGFLFLVLSGLYLWWPRNWSRRAVRNVVFFRRGLSAKARDFNWHNVIGFWSAVPLAIVVASAVMISYSWGTDLVYRIAGDAPPERGGRSAPAEEAPVEVGGDPFFRFDQLQEFASTERPGWQRISADIPENSAAPISFGIDAGSGGEPQKRSTVVLSRDGEVVSRETFADGSPGRRLRSILRFAHTGEVLGLFGQTIAGLASLGGAFLVWTGISLSLRRFRNWRRPKPVVARESSRPDREMAGV